MCLLFSNPCVAVVQYSIFGKTTAYPLVMVDEKIETELEKRFGSELPHSEDHEHDGMLLMAIRDLPNEWEAKSNTQKTDQLRRIYDSLPWDETGAPLSYAVHANQALKQKLEASVTQR